MNIRDATPNAQRGMYSCAKVFYQTKDIRQAMRSGALCLVSSTDNNDYYQLIKSFLIGELSLKVDVLNDVGEWENVTVQI